MTPTKLKRDNILVDDDVLANLKVLITMLAKQSYQAQPATNWISDFNRSPKKHDLASVFIVAPSRSTSTSVE